MYLVKLIKRVVIAVEKGNDHVSKNDETRLSLAHFLRTCAPTARVRLSLDWVVCESSKRACRFEPCGGTMYSVQYKYCI